MSDRRSLPDGYRVFPQWNPFTKRQDFTAEGPKQLRTIHETQDEAEEACWAHRDAVARRLGPSSLARELSLMCDVAEARCTGEAAIKVSALRALLDTVTK